MTSPTYKDYVEDAAGGKLLRDMVHYERTGPEEMLVPSRVKPDVVKKFLDDEKLDPLTWEPTLRAGDVARFYGVTGAVARFAETLKGGEKGVPAMLRSIECLRLMGDLGDGDQQQAAAAYYDRLLALPSFEEVVPAMVECYFHLNKVADEKKLSAAIAQRLRAATAAQRDPKQPSRQVILLREHLEADVPITARARAQKLKLLGERDPLKRATGLARTYIGLDNVGGVEWPKWAAFEIMAEVRRTSDANAVAGLQAALAAVPEGGKETQQYRDYAHGRALKAILFLCGQVKQEHKQWLVVDKTRRFQLQA